MAGELDLRLLRHFVAVAEELHFTRAAARLYVAQQALSRDIGRLERQLGVRLFVRTTRRVALTAEGQRLLVRARELLALHDQTLQELDDHHRPLLVDLLAEGHTPARVLGAARRRAPKTELVARFHGGFGAALDLLVAGGLDVSPGGWSASSRWRCCSHRSTRWPPWTWCRWRPFAAPGWTSAPATSTRRNGSTSGCACWRRSMLSRARRTRTPRGWRRRCGTSVPKGCRS